MTSRMHPRNKLPCEKNNHREIENTMTKRLTRHRHGLPSHFNSHGLRLTGVLAIWSQTIPQNPETFEKKFILSWKQAIKQFTNQFQMRGT